MNQATPLCQEAAELLDQARQCADNAEVMAAPQQPQQQYTPTESPPRPQDHSLWCEDVLAAPLISLSGCECSRYNTQGTGANELWVVMCLAVEEHPARTLDGMLKELEQLENLATTPMQLCAFESLRKQAQQAHDECMQISIDATNIRCVHESGVS